MGRIVIFEIPSKSRLVGRDLLQKLKELDNDIELRMMMSFDSWVERMNFKEEDSIPGFICKEDGTKPTAEEIERIYHFVRDSKQTPMEKRKKTKPIEPPDKFVSESGKAEYIED